jgi:vancomycin permeability regulator SanA
VEENEDWVFNQKKSVITSQTLHKERKIFPLLSNQVAGIPKPTNILYVGWVIFAAIFETWEKIRAAIDKMILDLGF